MNKEKLSCASCGVHNCFRKDKKFPDFCLTVNTAESSSGRDKINQFAPE